MEIQQTEPLKPERFGKQCGVSIECFAYGSNIIIAVITKRILIIDPDLNMQQVIQACLRKTGGWAVMTANSDEEGFALAEAHQPDAILLEERIPQINITKFLQQLRSNPKTEAIPIVFLTSELSLTERHRYLELGARGAIAKPFVALTLVAKISEILGWS